MKIVECGHGCGALLEVTPWLTPGRIKWWRCHICTKHSKVYRTKDDVAVVAVDDDQVPLLHIADPLWTNEVKR